MRSRFTRLHNLAIKYPIIEDNPKAIFDKEVSINNWVKKYAKIDSPIGITVEKTTKSIIARFHQFGTKAPMFTTDFLDYVRKGEEALMVFLMRRKITIDRMGAQTISQHIANESPEQESAVDKKVTASIDLGRKATSVYPTKLKGSAWIDRSLGQVEIETNDLTYEELLLKMPQSVNHLSKEVIPVLNAFTTQIKEHLGAVKDIRSATKELTKAIKTLNKTHKKLKK